MKKYIWLMFLFSFSVAYTQIRVTLPISTKIMNLSTQIAKTHLGLSENNNRGSHIKMYGKAVYGKPIDGFYYCYAFQYWSVDSACNVSRETNVFPKTGHCLTALNIAKKKYNTTKFASPIINDIIIWATAQGNGHAGRTIEVLDSKKWIVKTIEGNTSSDNSNVRNGGMVTYKKRYLKFPISRMLFRGVLNGK